MGADAVLQVVFYFPCSVTDHVVLVKSLGYQHLAIKIFSLSALLLFALTLNSTVVSHILLCFLLLHVAHSL